MSCSPSEITSVKYPKYLLKCVSLMNRRKMSCGQNVLYGMTAKQSRMKLPKRYSKKREAGSSMVSDALTCTLKKLSKMSMP